jgi:hypothetical protein
MFEEIRLFGQEPNGSCRRIKGPKPAINVLLRPHFAGGLDPRLRFP